jgi:hypothetical protein
MIQHGVELPIASLLQGSSIMDAAILQQRPPALSDSADHQVWQAPRSYTGFTGIPAQRSMGVIEMSRSLQALHQQQFQLLPQQPLALQQQQQLQQQQLHLQQLHQDEGRMNTYMQSLNRSLVNPNQQRQGFLLRDLMAARRREEEALIRLQLSSSQYQLRSDLGQQAGPASLPQAAQSNPQMSIQDQLYLAALGRGQRRTQIQAMLQAQRLHYGRDAGGGGVPSQPDDGSHQLPPPG